MRHLTALVSALLITACSHPLEIIGEGDILSASGERDCLLEDYQAAASDCTGNFVASDYLETYSAAPRTGWEFIGWQNYCPDSDTCSFDVQASNVKLFWGLSVPPLVAVFVEDNAIALGDQLEAAGKTWAQPDLFLNLSWLDITAQCPAGACGVGAILNGYAMEGWVLASVEDANALFNHFIGSEALGPGPDSANAGTGDNWGHTMLAAGFRPTAGSSNIEGVLLDQVEPQLQEARVGVFAADNGSGSANARTYGSHALDEAYGFTGAWFYRLPNVSDNSVTLAAREWAQPMLFRDLQWEEVEAVCNVGSTCQGLLGSVDVSGWQWATVSDTLALFNSFGVTPPLAQPGERVFGDEANWFSNLEAAGFQPLTESEDEREIKGWTSDLADDEGHAYTASMSDYASEDDDFNEIRVNRAATEAERTYYQGPDRGVWLYRDIQ